MNIEKKVTAFSFIKIIKPLGRQGAFCYTKLVLTTFLSFAAFSFAEAQSDTYKPHQIINGGDVKIEILTCSGDGAGKECEVIIYQQKRQQGIRKKVQSSILKDIQLSQTKDANGRLHATSAEAASFVENAKKMLNNENVPAAEPDLSTKSNNEPNQPIEVEVKKEEVQNPTPIVDTPIQKGIADSVTKPEEIKDTASSNSSTDLFAMQEEEDKKSIKQNTDITTSIFKTTRLVNGQSIENVGLGILDLRINHRFGTLNSGGYNLFGLDQASMRIGLDYGLTKRLMIGIGRSTYLKQYDGFVKYRILRQSTGKVDMPISISYAGGVILKTINENLNDGVKYKYSDRFSYFHQVIFARKFNDYFSLQVVPTVVHYNSVSLTKDPNDLLSLGFGCRIRISRRINITSEYYYQFKKFEGYYNSLSIGVDIETGGHVFQFHFTNSTGMTERTFINETTGRWNKGDIHFGFNISRVFTIKKPKELKIK